MKKFSCFLLIIAVMCSLAACKDNEQAPIETQTIVPTPPVGSVSPKPNEEVVSSAPLEVELLLQDNSQIVVFDTLIEYEQKLHELGFIEFKADLWRDTPDAPPSMSPIELTYNDDAFKLIFDYTSYHSETNEATTAEGWVLYGTKADTAINISSYHSEDFDAYDALDMSVVNNESTDFVHQIDYMMYKFKENNKATYVRCAAYHYPDTGNVYNLVYKYEDAMNVTQGAPHILAMIEEDIYANIDWDNSSNVHSPINTTLPSTFTLRCGDMDYLYNYEVPMTVEEWVNDSNYNVDGWYISDGICLSPNNQYIITDINAPIADLIDENNVIVASLGLS